MITGCCIQRFIRAHRCEVQCQNPFIITSTESLLVDNVEPLDDVYDVS